MQFSEVLVYSQRDSSRDAMWTLKLYIDSHQETDDSNVACSLSALMQSS